jgi:hypothetical protein
LAQFGQVRFTSTRVQRHVENLEYGLDDVCERLGELLHDHYSKSLRYRVDGPWHDVYLLPHAVPGFPDERLYIKFRLSSDCVMLELCSFHPEGWL